MEQQIIQKIKLTEKEYNNIMGENAFKNLQENLNLGDDKEENSSSLDI